MFQVWLSPSEIAAKFDFKFRQKHSIKIYELLYKENDKNFSKV